MTDDKTKTTDKTDKTAEDKKEKPAAASKPEVATKAEAKVETKTDAAAEKKEADKKDAAPAAEKKAESSVKTDAKAETKADDKAEAKAESKEKDAAKAEAKDSAKAEATAPAKTADAAEKKEAAEEKDKDKDKDKAEVKTEASANGDKSAGSKDRPKIDPGEAHVLVVEDNVPNFVLIARMLAYMGVQRCEWKTSGWQVVEFADTLPRIDLVLMDIRLPYEDGFQALEKLRSHPRLKETLVIAVTAEASVEQMNRAKESGFDGFLGKPLDPDRFPEQIKRVLNGEAVWEMH